MRRCLVVWCFLIFPLFLQGQQSTKRQKELETQRETLNREIKQINQLLFKNTAKKKMPLRK